MKHLAGIVAHLDGQINFVSAVPLNALSPIFSTFSIFEIFLSWLHDAKQPLGIVGHLLGQIIFSIWQNPKAYSSISSTSSMFVIDSRELGSP